MGDAFIVRRGGMADAFAVIAVAYPEGSVCTCSKGTKTLRAKDTSGYFLFLLPEAGTWTVSCTDGTKTKSQNVVIQWQYEAQWVQLTYEYRIFTENVGAETAISKATSDTSMDPTNDPKIENDKIRFIGSNSWGVRTVFVQIDLTPFTALKAEGIITYQRAIHQYLGITTGEPVSNGTDNGAQGKDTGSIVSRIDFSTSRETISLDVSSLSGQYYLMITGNSTADVFNWWLE